MPTKSHANTVFSPRFHINTRSAIQDISGIINQDAVGGKPNESSELKQPSAKRQVWSIINEAASQASASNMTNEHSSNYQITTEAEGELQSQGQNDDNVQQIIYITYDAEDKELQMLNQKSSEAVDSAEMVEMPQSADEDVINQLSAVASNLQQQSIDISTSNITNVIGHPTSPSIPPQDNWSLVQASSNKNVQIMTSATQSMGTVSANSQDAQLVIGQENEQQDGEGGVYVDIRLSDNDDPPIRLRVPPNFDPIAYASEYIQLQTAAQAENLLTSQSLEQQIQNVEGGVNVEASKAD